MMIDKYGNPVSTQSADARDFYADGVNRLITARPGVEVALIKALELDPNFALAHLCLARQSQVLSDRPTLKKHLELARQLAPNCTEQEQSLIEAFGLLLVGKSAQAYILIRKHIEAFPTDILAVQACMGVFGLIGFSGTNGREADQLAFTTQYLPNFQNDSWYLGQHAFAQCEVGKLDLSLQTIQLALDGDVGNAHSAHVHAHIRYERGETDTGYQFLNDWWAGNDASGALGCHISWHVGIWAIELGDPDKMWAFVDERVNPERAKGPPINILTDYVAFLFRLFCSGYDVPAERWCKASDYALEKFPNPGFAFIDVHAALAHFMANRPDEITVLIDKAKGPAGDIAKSICSSFHAMSQKNWAGAEAFLRPVLSSSERIGGSRAQRDLLDFAMVHALKQQGRTDEAIRLIEVRRPFISHELYTH